MTTYTVKGPSGKTYTLEGPEGATADQLGQAIRAGSRDERVAAETARERAEYDPTKDMSAGERFLAGAGGGMLHVARGLGQLVGLADQADVDEAKQLEAPLQATTAGKVGNFVGTGAALAPVALIPGANTYAGAAGIGALTGALTTEGGVEDRAKGALGGAAGGVVGQGLGQAVSAGAGAVKNAIARAAVRDAPRAAAVDAAQKAGYVLPPNDVAPTLGNAIVNALGGQIKTTQTAAARNQVTTNQLAARALGLPEDQPITVAALDALRQQAGRDYQTVAGTGTVTPTSGYDAALDAIVAPQRAAAAGFPNAAPNPLIQLSEGLRTQSVDAAAVVGKLRELRAAADKAYAGGDKEAGAALKNMAGVLENELEQHLAASGSPNALQAFQNARTQIAKSYDVQKALKGEDIDAAVLGRLAQKRPGRLTNELATIAETNGNFPKATRMLTEAPAPYSFIDAGLGGMGLATNPALAALVAARPLVRRFALSDAGQAAARVQPGPTVANALAALAADPRLRPLLATGALAEANQLSR